jgi:hypothetical protein
MGGYDLVQDPYNHSGYKWNWLKMKMRYMKSKFVEGEIHCSFFQQKIKVKI